jgi:RimJ/RimL family protein N-acetyltransferase
MEPKPLDPAGVYKLEHTPSGSPYIALSTRSPTPIFLTKYYANDPPDVEAALKLPAVNLHLVSAPTPYTLADAEWWVNQQLTTASNFPLQILRAGSPGEDGTLIGSVSLMPPDSQVLAIMREKKVLPEMLKEANECELGYYLHPDWRGNGVVKSGVKAILAWGKAEYGVNRVLVRIAEDNLDSRRVIESMGKYWVRAEAEDLVVDWPENKGGGKKTLLSWRWIESENY